MIVLRRNIQSEVDAPGDDADADADAGAAPKAEALKPTAPAPKPTAPAPAPTKTAPAKSQAVSKASKGDPAHSATPSGSTDAVGGEKALGKAARRKGSVVFEKHPVGYIPKQYKQMPLKHFLHSSNSSSSSSSGSNRNGD